MAENTTVALCADDFGLSMGVSMGIMEALAAGRLSAVSVMTTSSRWPAMGRELTRRAFDADIGLHLDLTLGRPLTQMRKFAPKGAFPAVANVVSAAVRGKLPTKEIRAEITRQLDRFEAVMERPPDHVDGHHHVHVLPSIRTALFEALAARGLAGRVWLRNPGDRLHRIFIRGAGARKALAVRSLAHGFRRAAKRRGFATNDGFAGFSDFDPREDYSARFETYLRARGRRHLIMCHPGYVDDDLRAQDPVTTTREQELAFLLSCEFEDLLARQRLSLARLSRAK